MDQSSFGELSADLLKVLGSSLLYGGATIGKTTTSVTFAVNGTTSTGASVGTLTNAPAVGNPTGYLHVTINGTVGKIPYWS